MLRAGRVYTFVYDAAGMALPELELMVTARSRETSRLDEIGLALPDPSLHELLALAPEEPSRLWLVGGEPTLRADLPELISALTAAGHSVGLVSDALALSSEGALRPLMGAGLRRVRVELHAARADAHDWLVGVPGAARRAVRAMGRLRASGAEVEILATVTRPTMTAIGELVEVAGSLGVSTVRLRRLVVRGKVAEQAIALVPRLALLEPQLENAVRLGARLGVRVVLHGFPECAARRVAEARALPGNERRRLPRAPEWQALAEPEHVLGCARCPGLPVCRGAPSDYVARFGRAEFESVGLPADDEPRAEAAIPPPRFGRAPETRLEAARRLAGRALHGDPQLSKPRFAPEVIHFRFGAPSRIACPSCGDAALDRKLETTRSVRLRLVRAAQEGGRVLCIDSAGSLAHPQAAELLREATLLSFERVEVAGEAGALDAASDALLYPLSGLTRFELALYGPDAASHDAHVGVTGAFEAALRVGERLTRLAGVQVGSFAVLHDATHVASFARAWAAGRLPGEPRFRLSSAGASLAELGLAAERIADGPARRALERVVPACKLGRELAPPRPVLAATFEQALGPHEPSGSAAEGAFSACGCDAELAARCPGVAKGWRLEA